MNTTWEKFHGATMSLTRAGTLKDRLNDAYRNHLARVGEDELPKELRDDFRMLTRALTRERPLLRGEDSVRATLRKMSNGEAEEVASSVVHIFSAMPRGYASPVRSASAAQIVPLYLAEVAAEA